MTRKRPKTNDSYQIDQIVHIIQMICNLSRESIRVNLIRVDPKLGGDSEKNFGHRF